MIAGRTLVERVFERARDARRLSRLIVATDDERIASVVRGFGGDVVMTSRDHASGTDRLAEVARSLPAEVYVNIQGDEPLLDPRDIDRLVDHLETHPAVDMATLAEPIADETAARDPNVVKVVCDDAGRALYFSRSLIPWAAATGSLAPPPWLRHVGLYAYRRGFLMEFASWSPGVLETREGLEQLRTLERGRSIGVLPASVHYHGVDTPDDVPAVERALRPSP